jgi:3-hydroxybutyryl-CoA dehydrogenase
VKLEDIRRVLIVGAGTMGQQIALQCAMHGYTVVVYDIAPDRLETARARIQGYAAHLAASRRLGPAEAEAALAHLSLTADAAAAAAEADLLSESVPEDPALKGQVLAQFNALCPPRTLFTTNTSTLLPSMYAAAGGRPAQLVALHFHSYVWDSNVVDVMPHPGTSAETVETVLGFARRIGQIPIELKRESSGYVFNAMLSALTEAALRLVVSGVTSVENVDRAWMGVMKTPIGPFGILDVVGLKTAWDITQYWARARGDAQQQAHADFLKGYLDQGRLGMQSGRGFYTYPAPAYQQPDFLSG